MDLNEIEQAADGLAEALCDTDSKGLAGLYADQLRGLKDLATIKALAAGNEERSVSVQLRERELAAMESVASSMPKQAPCGAASPEIVLAGGMISTQYCRWPSGHVGPHKSARGTEWIADGPSRPQDLMVLKLWEVIESWRQFAQGLEESGIQKDADTSSAGHLVLALSHATQIEDILKEAEGR